MNFWVEKKLILIKSVGMKAKTSQRTKKAKTNLKRKHKIEK